MSKKFIDIFGRVVFGIVMAALLLFLLLDPDDENVPPKLEKEKINIQVSE